MEEWTRDFGFRFKPLIFQFPDLSVCSVAGTNIFFSKFHKREVRTSDFLKSVFLMLVSLDNVKNRGC